MKMPVQCALLPSFPPTDMIAHTFPRRTEAGFTLIEICMVLVLLGILTAVAVPKYFDLQEESRLRAADAAIAEAQARINAYFGQQLLADGDCIKAAAAVNADLALPSGKIADATNAQGKVFGDVTLSIGKLLANGSSTLVTAYFDGKALSGGPHGRLYLAKCSNTQNVASALGSFGSIGTTGNPAYGGTGVIGSYVQSNSAANELVIEEAQQYFSDLMQTIGWEGDVGYWRLVQKGGDQTNVFWTRHDISNIGGQRVPFIQAQLQADGTTRYAVGLVGVTKLNSGGAMLINDKGNSNGPVGTLYGYGPSTNGYYVSSSAQDGYTVNTAPDYFGSIEDAVKAYDALEAAFSGNAALKNGQDDLSGTAFPSL